MIYSDPAWDQVVKERDQLRGENQRLRAALTPTIETKVAYMGEFEFPLPYLDEDGDEALGNVNVPWTTIKKIMAAIIARAALSDTSDGGKGDA